MRILLLLSLLPIALAVGPLVGSNPCTWGPSYWCQHLDAAKECKAVDHCLENNWNKLADKPQLEVPPKPECSYCQFIIAHIHSLMAAGKDEAQILAMEKEVCDSLKHPEMIPMCHSLNDHYIHEIITLLKNGMKASDICHLLKKCAEQTNVKTEVEQSVPLVLMSQATPLGKIEEPQSVKLGSLVCEECKAFIAYMRLRLTNNDTEAIVENFLNEKVCVHVPQEAQPLCKEMVKEMVPQLIALLKSELASEDICKLIQLCPSSIAKNHKLVRDAVITLQAHQSPAVQGATCQLCEAIITDIRQMITDNKTDAEVEDFLRKQLCSHLGQFASQCVKYVDEFLPQIINLIKSELDPATVCKALGVCSSVTGRQQKVRQAKPSMKAGPQCFLCEFVMKEVDRLIVNNKSAAAIKHALDEVCNILPATIRDDCNKFVDNYAAAIIDLLIKEASPKIICSFLGLCASQDSHLSALTKKPTVALKSDATCEVCTTLVTYVKSMLAENSTEQEIIHLLEKICNFLPAKDRKQCDSIVEQYTPTIILLLNTELSAKQICTALNLCTAKLTAAQHVNGKVNLIHEVIKTRVSPRLGENKCTWGPAYWCKSHSHAYSCGSAALTHCREKVWLSNRDSNRL